MGYVSKMAASLWGRVGEFLPISLCSCNHFRCAARLASRVTRSGPSKPIKQVKQVKQVKTVKKTMDMKATLTRQLNRRKELAVRRVSAASKPKAAAAEESISKGRREIIIEPSCQNPAFKAEDSKLQMTSFFSMGLRDDVLKGLESMAITKPTVTQMVSIPPILNREHVLCAAQTGTGKTLAYLLPIVHHLKEEQDKGVISRLKRPRALIVVPNRELAFQVLKVAKSLSHSTRFRSALLTGGRKLRVLKSGLELPVDLLVGTPGTLLEFRERGRLFFSDVSYLVIDEADSMFDKTFKSETMDLLQTMSIRQDTPPSRTSLPVDTQVMIVGATLPSELVGTLQEMLPDIHTCTSSLHRVLPHVRHKFVKVQQHRKAETLLEILREDLEVADRRSVVFCNTTPSCDFLGHFLTDNGVSHIKLHSTVAIQERSNLFKEFQQEKSRILVCTDIASRGLDTDVDHVINFDFPLNVTDYIHRVGRTGRVRTGAKQREVADATSLMTHNRDVRIALIIEEAALTQRSVKSVEARMTKPAPGRREVLSSSKRPGRHVSSLQAILPRRRSRKPGQDKEETSRRKNKLMTDTNAASVA